MHHVRCGCSSSGRAPPCQGGGSEFEPRHPLHKKEPGANAPGSFLLCGEEGENHLNATVRWTVYDFRLDGNHTIIYRASSRAAYQKGDAENLYKIVQLFYVTAHGFVSLSNRIRFHLLK